MSAADAKKPEPATHAFIASALRTLETEREGVAALAAAMSDGLGAAFRRRGRDAFDARAAA